MEPAMILDIGNKNKEQLDSATELMIHLETEQIYKDTMDRLAKEKDDQIELALANIREALRLMERDENILRIYAQVQSAEHHLTREV